MKRVIIPIGIILIASALTASMILYKKEPEKKELSKGALLVDTIALKKQDVRLTVSSQGNITPRTETTLISEISGLVLEVSSKFVVGGLFEKGEILLKLDPTDYEVALQQANANLLSMRAKLTQEEARAEQAVQEWALSGRPKSQAPLLALRTPYLDEGKANVLFAEANLRKARRKLEQTLIRAPYKGMVRDKLVDVGQYVSIGTQLANTFAVDFAEVRLPLTDRDIAYLELPGLSDYTAKGEVTGPDVKLTSVIGEKTFNWEARIVRTEGVVDQRTRVHFAVARIADPYGLNGADSRPPLSIGSFVEATIYGVTAREVIPIPRHSLHGINQVLIMDSQHKLHVRDVSILYADKNHIYIKEGVSEDERAIITTIEEAVDGMSVRSSQTSR